MYQTAHSLFHVKNYGDTVIDFTFVVVVLRF